MNIVQESIALIKKAEQDGLYISNEEILRLLKSYKDIAKDQELLETVITIIRKANKQITSIKKLSARENQVFQLIGLGLSSREIATLLSISLETVGTHRKNIIKKLGITGTGALYKYAYDYSSNFNK